MFNRFESEAYCRAIHRKSSGFVATNCISGEIENILRSCHWLRQLTLNVSNSEVARPERFEVLTLWFLALHVVSLTGTRHFILRA